MIRPTVEMAVAFNAAVRTAEEWFDEPDELDRLAKSLAAIDDIEDPVLAAGVTAFRVTRAQPFGEGTLDRNGVDGAALIPPEDRKLADLLVKAAAGHDVESEIVDLLRSRAEGSS